MNYNQDPAFTGEEVWIYPTANSDDVLSAEMLCAKKVSEADADQAGSEDDDNSTAPPTDEHALAIDEWLLEMGGMQNEFSETNSYWTVTRRTSR